MSATLSLGNGEKWSQTGLIFVVYNGTGSTATAYAPAIQYNQNTCSHNGSTCA